MENECDGNAWILVCLVITNRAATITKSAFPSRYQACQSVEINIVDVFCLGSRMLGNRTWHIWRLDYVCDDSRGNCWNFNSSVMFKTFVCASLSPSSPPSPSLLSLLLSVPLSSSPFYF